jgi:hypothetical protein
MGLPVLFVSLRYLVHDFTHRGEQRAKAEARVATGGGAGATQRMTSRLPWTGGGGFTFGSSGRGGGTGGQIAKLERLQRLRESGALTELEFEREKAKVLSES